jgi:hypothetical protein
MREDENYIIDLCDAVLNQTAIRQHRFDFLTGDHGHQLPVDAYYSESNLVVEFHEKQHSEHVPIFDGRETISGVTRGIQRRIYDHRRREILPEHGITIIEFRFDEFCHRGRRLSRMPDIDKEVVTNKLIHIISENNLSRIPQASDFNLLPEKLKEIILTLGEKPEDIVQPWSAILMGLVGCYYSLNQAMYFLGADRGYESQMEDCLNFLNLLQNDKQISIGDELCHRSWSVGFHLNNAELRISSALHRLLKLYYEKDAKISMSMIIEMIKKEFDKNGTSRAVQCAEAKSIIVGFWNKKDFVNYEDITPEDCIARVWNRVNELKHGTKPIGDEEFPIQRWKDCFNALDALIIIFKDFAMDKQLL